MDMTALLVGLAAAVGPTLMGAGAWRAAARASVQATAANRAVNDRPAGDPTLSEEVTQIVVSLSALTDRVGGLADGQATLGKLAKDVDRKVTMHLAYHEAERETAEAARRGLIDRREGAGE